MLRDICFFTAFFCCFSFANAQNYNYTNDGGKGKSIAFEQPIVEENGEVVKKDSLVQIFRNMLQSRWLDNSAIKVVAIEELERIIKVQKRSQDAKHSDKTAIDAGNFIAEVFSVQTTIYISSQGKYSVRIKITDNEKGTLVSNWMSSEYEDKEDFINYAANDVALNILPMLGVELSSRAKQRLSYRKNSDNSLLEVRKYLDNLTSSISDLDKQLSEVTKSKMQEVGSIAEKARIEAELEQLKLQEKEANERVKRLEEDDRRREEDRQRAKSRSETLNKKIAKNGLKYDKLANKKRKEYASELTFNARISMFERKKSSLVSLKTDSIEKIKAYYLQEDEDCRNEIIKIEDAPYTAIEKNAKGKITSEAKKERKEKIKKVQQASKLRKEKYFNEQFSHLEPSFEVIRKEILKDIPELKGQRESSLLNPDLLRFGNYDGSKNAWVASISLILAGNILSDERILIPYKNITGLNPGYNTKEEKEAYNATVEEYNSYFASNIPLIYVEINYDIIPMSVEKSSKYTVKINSYVFKKIEGDEVIWTLKPSSSIKTLTITPVVAMDYSIPLLESHVRVEVDKYIKQKEKEEKKREAERKRLDKEIEREKKRLENKKEKEAKEAERKREAEKKRLEQEIKEGKNKTNTENKNSATGKRKSNSSLSHDFDFLTNLFSYGYIPLGVDFGFSYTSFSAVDFGLNVSYLFYTKYFDVGPEIKIFFTPYQFDFALAAKLQKEVYENIYIAGGVGLDIFSMYPHACVLFSFEAGYIFLDNWSVSLKLDVFTQPQYLFRVAANYYFR